MRTLSDLIRSPASLSHARDGGGFGLPIWWWGLGYGVVGVVVVAVGGLLVETLFSLSLSQSLLARIKTFRSSPWVANVDVVCGGQSGRWVLRLRCCLGWGLVDAVVWGLRFGIWVAPPPTVKWVWDLGCSASDGESNGFWVCCCELNLYIVAAFGFLIC
uniref:Transmembrane protein n=1 Tax=Fagus sylvatica TaxID=28930 RepID=A0A2N9ETW5_FAGSY